MQRLSVWRLGLAMGAAFAALYLACVFIMLTVPHELVVRFFNSILHGWNVAPIMRWDMPWGEAAVGVTEIFILGWLFGVLLAVFYNFGLRPEER